MPEKTINIEDIINDLRKSVDETKKITLSTDDLYKRNQEAIDKLYKKDTFKKMDNTVSNSMSGISNSIKMAFSGMSGSIKNFFSKKPIDDLKEEVKSGLENVGTVTGKHMSDIMGSTFMSVFDDLKSVAGSIWNMSKNALGFFTGNEEDETDSEKATQEIRDSIDELTSGGKLETYSPDIQEAFKFLSENLGDDAEKTQDILSLLNENFEENQLARTKAALKDKQPKIKSTPLMMAVMALGVLIGAVVKSLIIPFELLYQGLNKLMPIGKWLSDLGSSLLKLPGLKTFGKGGKGLEILGKISGFFKELPKRSKLIGKFVKGFMKGFKILGWPLTILLGVIDFIKGFMTTEGSIIDKIKGGLIGAIKGFIEFPVKVIGWIADKILGLFGVEIKGGAGNAMMKGLMWVVSKALDVILWPFRMLYKGFKMIIDFFSSSKEGEEGPGILDKIKKYAILGLKIAFWPFYLAYKGFKKIIDFFSSSKEGEEGPGILDKIKKYAILGLKIVFAPYYLAYKGIKKIIDFFSSSKEGEEGPGILDKLIDASKQALYFITWPYRMLYKGLIWLVGKATEFAASDTGQSVLDTIIDMSKQAIDFITWPYRMLYKGIKKIIDWFATSEGGEPSILDQLWTYLKELPGKVKDWILENVPGAKLAAKAGGAIASGAKKAAGGVKNAWNWAWGNDKEEEEENVEKKKSIQDLTKTKVPSTQNKIDDIEKEKALMLAKEKKDVADLNKKSSEQLEKANKLIKEQTKEGKEGTKSMVNVISSTSNQQNIQPDEIKDEIESFGLLIGNKGMS